MFFGCLQCERRHDRNHRVQKQPKLSRVFAKAVALPDTVKCVTIVALGRSRLITPADSRWDDWSSAREASAAEVERDQPADQQRKAL